MGPNCLGVLDHTSDLDLTVNDFPVGNVALISQSGNVAIDVAAQMSEMGLGVSRFASVGNQADVDVAELVENCCEHEGTRAMAVYAEGFLDGRRFARAALSAREAGKPVVLLTVGRGSGSARSAASHTGSMVSSEAIVRAACEAVGAEVVTSPAEMAGLLQAMVRTRPPKGPRVAVFADGGGHASLASDSLEHIGLQVEQFSGALRADLAGALPPSASVANPVDIAGGGEQDITCFARIADLLTASSEVDAILMTGYFGGFGEYSSSLAAGEVEAARDIARIAATSDAAYVVHSLFPASLAAQALREGGIAVYRNVETAAWALSRLSKGAVGAPVGVPSLPIPEKAIVDGGYWSSRQLLEDAGMPFVKAALIESRAELLQAAQSMSFPLVLKALIDEHKSDRGGVVLDVRTTDDLENAWVDLKERLEPPAFSVEEMADLTDAVELIIGVRHDRSFGPVVLVGIGGTEAELLSDTRCALAPVDEATARRLLLSLQMSPLLTGYRGRPEVDLGEAARLVALLSRFAAAHPEIAEIECNPVAVSPRGALALDARIITAQPDSFLGPSTEGAAS